MFGATRDMYILSHDVLREYRMFLGARDYGANLDVVWFLTLSPGFLKSSMSTRVAGNPLAFSMRVDIFTQQDLRAWTTIAHHCVKRAVDAVYEDLHKSPVGLDTSSKGFLNVW
jgi:hypothetical protein